MLFRNTWTSQPQQPVDVDRNGLGKGVQMLLTQVGGKVVDVANPSIIWTPNGNAKTKAASKGVVATFDGVDDYFSATGYSHIVGARGTFFIWLPRVGAFDTNGTVWFGTNTGAASFFQSSSTTAFCFGSGSFTNGTVTSIASTNNTSLVFSANTTVNTQRYFRNGISEGTLNASTPTAFASGSKTFNFGRYVGGTTWDADADILIAGFTTEIWGAAQAKAFHDNPWQLFAPTSRKIWVPGVAGSSHTLVGANSTQTNTSGTGAISQTHVLAGAASTQANTSGTGAVTQAHQLAGAGSSQANTSGTGAISQTHVLAGAPSTQANTSGTGAITLGAVHTLVGANSAQANTSSAGAISQVHVLVAAPSVQDNIASASAIVQMHMLAGAACSQTATSGTGSIVVGDIAATVAGARTRVRDAAPGTTRPTTAPTTRPGRVHTSARPAR